MSVSEQIGLVHLCLDCGRGVVQLQARFSWWCGSGYPVV